MCWSFNAGSDEKVTSVDGLSAHICERFNA